MTVLTTIPNGASYRDIRDTINALLTDVAGLKAGTVTPTPAPTPTPTVTALPKASSIVARWSAASLAALADGAKVPSWNSSVGTDALAQPDSAKQPRFFKSGAGGKPYVKFDGASFLAFALSGAAGAAVASGQFAVQIVFQSITNTGNYGYFMDFGGYNDFAIVLPTASTPEAGSYVGGGTMIPVDDLGFQPIGATKGSAYGNRSMIKGTMSAPGIIASGSGSGTGYVGGNPDFGLTGAEISEIIVWSVPFEQPDALQFTKWSYEQHGLAFPWAAESKFRLWDGNSTFAGYGSSYANGTSIAVPFRVAKKRGWKLGTYTFIGSVGRSLSELSDQAAARADPCVALLAGATAILVAGEYANESAATADINALNAKVATYNVARKAAGWKVIYVTASDIADNNTTYRGDPTRMATYNNFCTDLSKSKADAVVTLHLDQYVGVPGACPNEPGPYGPEFSDVVHLTDQGYDHSASYMAASSALA